MEQKDAVRRPQSRFAAGEVEPQQFSIPTAWVDDPAFKPATGANGTSALDIQVAGDHYKSLTIQPVEFIHANGIGYFEGNVIKYVTRWRNKNGIKDLEKAKHYIDLLIELESK
jgi:hypothetical protein